MELESRRDVLYDEVASLKGQISVLEEVIKNIYDRIITVNKEVQQQELREGVEAKAREEEADKIKERQKEQEAFAKAKRGLKTPKPERQKRSRKK